MATSESPVLASPMAKPRPQCAPASCESQNVAGAPLLAVLALTTVRPPGPDATPGSANEDGAPAPAGSAETDQPPAEAAAGAHRTSASAAQAHAVSVRGPAMRGLQTPVAGIHGACSPLGPQCGRARPRGGQALVSPLVEPAGQLEPCGPALRERGAVLERSGRALEG